MPFSGATPAGISSWGGRGRQPRVAWLLAQLGLERCVLLSLPAVFVVLPHHGPWVPALLVPVLLLVLALVLTSACLRYLVGQPLEALARQPVAFRLLVALALLPFLLHRAGVQLLQPAEIYVLFARLLHPLALALLWLQLEGLRRLPIAMPFTIRLPL